MKHGVLYYIQEQVGVACLCETATMPFVFQENEYSNVSGARRL